MASATLNPTQLQALSKDLADIAQRYNQSTTTHLSLRQYKTHEDGEEVLYVVSEDDQGKEWIVVKVALIPPAAKTLSLKFDLCQTH